MLKDREDVENDTNLSTRRKDTTLKLAEHVRTKPSPPNHKEQPVRAQHVPGTSWSKLVLAGSAS